LSQNILFMDLFISHLSRIFCIIYREFYAKVGTDDED
jgi:hypothetical protein